MTLPSGSKLGPYEILSAIGAGGMGEVYRAKDPRLGRDVAIKVLPQSLVASPDALARFEREAKAVAALSHPNILSIFDFGTHEAIPYAVTELLEGETLRGKLDTGPISQKLAVDYGLQIAKGLSAAHERGVVHRDLKPENLFVTKDGHVKILDFGLAKRVEAVSPDKQTSGPTVSGHTEPGTVMGTMGYMSPEQVRGLPVDHRSDIFSFGTILYELLTGKRAFKKDTASDTMAAIMRDELPELSESGRNISPALDHVVRHCLEKDRDNRFQSAKDIAFALSEASSPTFVSGAQFVGRPPVARSKAVFLVAAAVFLAVLAGVFLWRRSRTGAAETERVKRVAVLPFENQGPPEDDYFADGIADEVRGKLTSLPGLQVIARASSTPYKKTTKTPKQIAEELNAPYLLTGTVRWEKAAGGSRVHVTPELVDVTHPETPTATWQQPFDAALTDVFQVQSEIATKVAHALGRVIGATEEKQLSKKPTQNLSAYDAFLKGRDAQGEGRGTDPASVRKALGFYEQAVALDPDFVDAWAELSQAASLLYANGVPTAALGERARQAAEKAIALAPEKAEGYAALGGYERLVKNDLGRAAEQYEKGRRLAPGDSRFLFATALVEQGLGRWEESLEHLRQAERLNPLSVPNKRVLGFTLLRMRRYSEAREALDRALAIAPTNRDVIEYKAMTYLAQGDLPGARSVLKAAPKEVDQTGLVADFANYYGLGWVLDDEQRDLLLRLTPSAFDDDKGHWAACLADAYALRGDAANMRRYVEEAAKAFGEQLVSAPEDSGRHMELGLALALLGRKVDAIREGERAVALDPVAKDQLYGAYIQHQLACIYIRVGEPEKALDQLEPLLKMPYYLSPNWLAIDPTFDPLRGNPRFQKLVASAK
jgi:TolB-like protein/tetratricopeptide (TPR) repeat protein